MSPTGTAVEDPTAVFAQTFSIIDRFGNNIYCCTETEEMGYSDDFDSTRTVPKLKFQERTCSYICQIYAKGTRTSISYSLRDCTFNEGEYSITSDMYPSYKTYLVVTSSQVTMRYYDPNFTDAADHYKTSTLLSLNNFKFSYKANVVTSGTTNIDGLASIETAVLSYSMSGNVIDFNSFDGLYWRGTLNPSMDELTLVQIEPEKKDIGVFTKL